MRSTNAQIEFLLRRALSEAGRLPAAVREMRRQGRPRLDESAALDTDSIALADGDDDATA